MQTERIEVGSTTSRRLPTVRAFNDIVCEAIDKTLEDLLGSQVMESFYAHLRDRFGVGRDELPYRIDTISMVLENVFGVQGASVIERKVAKNLYDKILVPFNDEQGTRLDQFLRRAKEIVSRDSYYV